MFSATRGIDVSPINSTENSTDDGSVFNSARLDARNIVLTMILYPTPTIEDTRQLSYKYFPIKKPLTLVFETDIDTYKSLIWTDRYL